MTIDAETLQTRLASLTGERDRAAVALGIGGCIVEARAGRPEPPSAGTPAYPIGCISKLLTAALACRVFEHQGWSLDACIHSFAGPWQHADALSGVTIRDLLEHRHGIDDSATEIRSVGWRRARVFDAIAAAPRLHAPGMRYSYSQLGPVVVAAMLEHVTGRRFEMLLRRHVLAPCGVDVEAGASAPHRAAGSHCPATGGGFRMPLADLVRCVTRHCPDLGPAPLPASRMRPLPGWHPVERGVVDGWKVYAGGWLGHQSVYPGASALVRVNPKLGAAVAVFSGHRPAGLVAARLLGDRFRELGRVELPRRDGEAPASIDAARFAGAYARRAEWIAIDAIGDDEIAIRRSTRGHPARADAAHAATGVHAGDRVFFVRERRRATGAFVQFVGGDGDGDGDDGAGIGYLWDGQCLFPRSRSDASGSSIHS